MPESSPHKLQLTVVNQIGIVVRDADAVIKSWESLFGIGPWEIREMRGKGTDGQPVRVKLAFASLGGVSLELIQPVEGRIFHHEFLEAHGEGLHHLGFHVDDVDAEADNLVRQGASVLSNLPGRYAYLGTGGPGGVIFEVIRRPVA